MELTAIDTDFETVLIDLLASLRETMRETQVTQDKPMQVWHFMEVIAARTGKQRASQILPITGDFEQHYRGMTFVAGVAKMAAQIERFLASSPKVDDYCIKKQTGEVKVGLLCGNFYQGKWYMMDKNYNIVVIDPLSRTPAYYKIDCPNFMKSVLFITFMSIHPLNDKTLLLAVNPYTYSKISLMNDSTAVVSDFFLDSGNPNTDVQTLIVPTESPNVIIAKLFLRRFDILPVDQMIYPRLFFEVKLRPGAPLTQILHLKPFSNFRKFIAAGSTDYFTVVDTTKKDTESQEHLQTHYSVRGSVSRVDSFEHGETSFVMIAVDSSQLLVYSAAAGREDLEVCGSLSVDDCIFGACFFQFNFSSDPVVCLLGEHGVAVWHFLSHEQPKNLHEVKGKPLDPCSQVQISQFNREFLSVVKKIDGSSFFSVYRVRPTSIH